MMMKTRGIDYKSVHIEYILCIFLCFIDVFLKASVINKERRVTATGLSSYSLPAGQYQALYDLYTAANGENWKWQSVITEGEIWNFSNPNSNPCADRWQGIKCMNSSSGQTYGIVSLNLCEYNLVGFIPNSLGNLQNLTYLNFSSNFLTGTVPESIYSLTGLTVLNFGSNDLHGTLSSSIGNLLNLTIFYLYYNEFTGSIPPSIGNLQSLQLISFSYNQFNSSLPDSLYKMQSLLSLNLDSNKLTGTIPENLNNLTKLTAFLINQNAFFGPLPLNFIPSSLEELSLSNNLLSGEIPSNIGNLSSLKAFNIQHNNFHGTFPMSLLNSFPTNLLYFGMGSNSLHGNITNIFIKFSGSLIGISVSNNQFTGYLPIISSLNTYFEIYNCRSNYFTGIIPNNLLSLRKLLIFDISSNIVSGNIQFNNVYPEYINASSNILSGNLDNFITIPTNTSSKKKYPLYYIILNDNDFTGTVPDWTFLPDLYMMTVSNNRLTGTLPSLSTVSFYAASTNCFHGSIPQSLCQSPSLLVVAINGATSSANCHIPLFPRRASLSPAFITKYNLENGIPSCLLNMPLLEILQISGNGLTGTLPSKNITMSSTLLDLDLSHNSFTGTIPLIYQEKAWESLDLSYNLLTGTLSHSFHSYENANTSLTLQVNRLSGYVPLSLLSAKDINILDGNLFDCNDHPHLLPSHDPNFHTYSCGSDTVNVVIYFWISITTVFVCLLSLIYMQSNAFQSFRAGCYEFCCSSSSFSSCMKNISYFGCCLCCCFGNIQQFQEFLEDFFHKLHKIYQWYAYFHEYCSKLYAKEETEQNFRLYLSAKSAEVLNSLSPDALQSANTSHGIDGSSLGSTSSSTSSSSIRPTQAPSPSSFSLFSASLFARFPSSSLTGTNKHKKKPMRNHILLLYLFNYRARFSAVCITGFILFLLLPTYSALSKHYSSYAKKYAWTISGLFLTGEISANTLTIELFLFIFFVSMLITFIWLIRVISFFPWKFYFLSENDSTERQRNIRTFIRKRISTVPNNLRRRSSAIFQRMSLLLNNSNTNNKSSEPAELEGQQSQDQLQKQASRNNVQQDHEEEGEEEEEIVIERLTWQEILSFCLLGLFNFLIMITVDIIYVIIVIHYDPVIVLLAEIALAFIKIFWNNFFIWNCLIAFHTKIAFFLQHYCHFSFIVQRNWEILSEMDVSFISFNIGLNNLIYPIIAIMAISTNCFYNAISPPAPVSISYTGTISSYSSKNTVVTVGSSYDPPFTYGYQCSSVIYSYYCPVFILMLVMESILFPSINITLRMITIAKEKHQKQEQQQQQAQEIEMQSQISRGNNNPSNSTKTNSIDYVENPLRSSGKSLRERNQDEDEESSQKSSRPSESHQSAASDVPSSNNSNNPDISPPDSNKSMYFYAKSMILQFTDDPENTNPDANETPASPTSSEDNDKKTKGLEKKKRSRYLFEKNRYAVRFNSYLLLLVAYGAIFPPLAIIICISIIFRSIYEEVIIGRLLFASHQKNLIWCEKKLQADCQGLMTPMKYSLAIIIPIATLLYSYLIFDTFGKDEDPIVAIIPAICFFLFALCLFAFLSYVGGQISVFSDPGVAMAGGEVNPSVISSIKVEEDGNQNQKETTQVP